MTGARRAEPPTAPEAPPRSRVASADGLERWECFNDQEATGTIPLETIPLRIPRAGALVKLLLKMMMNMINLRPLLVD